MSSFPFFFRALAHAVCMSMECVSITFFSRARARCVYEHGVSSLSFFFRALARVVCMSSFLSFFCACSGRDRVVHVFVSCSGRELVFRALCV